MNEEVKSILDTVHVGVMATVNRDRTPAVAPLHFARLDDSIIWISSRTSRHAQNAMRTGYRPERRGTHKTRCALADLSSLFGMTKSKPFT
ncbi:hypothetical protein B7Y94_05015 [Candidatus Saccharibacteria bacterium 32-49-12]|nr:MAG: hypothetical protein B7Y94_05015 [Candidatus Saccharibacteria bacterium 32-49-12]